MTWIPPEEMAAAHELYAPPRAVSALSKWARRLFGSRGDQSFFQNSAGTILLLLMVTAYVVVFSAWSIMAFQKLAFSAYDAGIHDQAVWKLATGRGLFNTVRGLNIWGDHCWLIMLFLAPFYWIAPHMETLLVIQSLALGAAAIPLAALAYRCLGSRALALALAAAWLLSPALQNTNMENLHPEVIATAFIMWAIAAAEAKSWKWYWVAVVLALMCKEDVSFTMFGVGIWVLLRRHRPAGLATMLISGAWFIFCMKTIMPLMNDVGFFRHNTPGYWFTGFWKNKFDLQYYFKTFGRPDTAKYIWQLCSPLLLLSLLEPFLLMAALPAMAINIFGGGYLVSINYHYNYGTLPVLFAAAVLGIGVEARRIWAGRTLKWAMVIGILAASVWANDTWSKLPVRKVPAAMAAQARAREAMRGSGRLERMLALLPQDPDVPIAVSHDLLTQCSHRNEVYMFPNPWQARYWGIRGENLPNPDRIQALLINFGGIDTEIRTLVEQLVRSGQFRVTAQEGNWIVAVRNATVMPEPSSDPAMGETGNKIRVDVYVSQSELKALSPVLISEPALSLTTTIVQVPRTRANLRTLEGGDFGASKNVQARFSGTWEAQGKAVTTFRVRADDGCRLVFGNGKVLSHEGVHAYGELKTFPAMRLPAGKVPIVVDYFQWGGDAGLLVEWAGPDGRFQPLANGNVLP